MMTRRRFLALAATAASCSAGPLQSRGEGRINVRVSPPRRKIGPGEHLLGLGRDRDGLLCVPKSYQPDKPAPFILLMHGAGGWARRLEALFPVAYEFGAIVLSPESRDRGTWDGLQGSFGPDIEFLQRALTHCFDRCAVDTRRLAIGGFSDGATYALSAGLASGDVFTHIIAFSPGFVISGAGLRGKPRIFVSHGTADRILPIESTSRRIVPALERAGYPVKYREFEGPHTVPPAIGREAFQWWVGT
jgi:phospholipase/carboxylesterase